MKFFFWPVLLLLLSGCTPYKDLPAGTVHTISTTSAIVTAERVSLPPLQDEAPPANEYRVGMGDSLYINVQGQPQLGSPVTTTGSRVTGSRVDGNGEIHLPMIGSVVVNDLSLAEIQRVLEERFSSFLNKPWVVVEVAEYRSQPLFLLGQFRTPGTYYLDRPYTLLQGISLAGGLVDAANLRSARLIRAGKTLPVDLYSALQEGNAGQNIWLKAGDTIFVPDDKNQNVFVFGAVKRPGAVVMPNGQLNLAQALATADINQIRGEGQLVRIIRSRSATQGELLVIDFGKELRGETISFPLLAGDIIYVPRSAIGTWNEVLVEILPSLQTISAILQPFVSIKYLSN